MASALTFLMLEEAADDMDMLPILRAMQTDHSSMLSANCRGLGLPQGDHSSTDEDEPRPKKRKSPEQWQREIYARRASRECNTAYKLQNELIEMKDDTEFRTMLRMDHTNYCLLLELVTPYIRKMDTNCRLAITAAERLSVTLKYMATGETQTSVGRQYRISRPVVGRIIRETTVAIYQVLKDDYLKTPTTPEEWRKVASVYESRWNYPNCGGSLDGKHVHIIKPPAAGSKFFNYKKHHSIILMALVSANYEFLYVDVGRQGRAGDGGVWNASTLKQHLDSGSLNLPGDGKLKGTDVHIPYHFVADAAFGMSTRVMKPYGKSNQPMKQKIFDYRLTRGRRCVENAFGILVNRFRIFLTPILLDTDVVGDVVLAACALHNFLRKRAGAAYITPTKQELQSLCMRESTGMFDLDHPVRGENAPANAKHMRDMLADYFQSPHGSVHWQERAALRSLRTDASGPKGKGFKLIITAYSEDFEKYGSCGSRFKCANNKCVDYDLLCDTIDHCGDFSDESPFGLAQCGKIENTTASKTEEGIISKFLSLGVTAAISITVGSVVIFVVCIVCTICCCCRCMRKRTSDPTGNSPPHHAASATTTTATSVTINNGGPPITTAIHPGHHPGEYAIHNGGGPLTMNMNVAMAPGPTPYHQAYAHHGYYAMQQVPSHHPVSHHHHPAAPQSVTYSPYPQRESYSQGSMYSSQPPPSYHRSYTPTSSRSDRSRKSSESAIKYTHPHSLVGEKV